MKKCLLFLQLLILCQVSLWAQNNSNLLVKPSDLRLVYEEGKKIGEQSGYHLFIRKKDGMESVMLTETTKDPSGKSDNFAMRAKEFNLINGNEKRILNGKELNSQYSKYSLIDSTPEKDEEFTEAFHIYIPSEMVYGYPWSREGTIKIDRGTFINIRTFEKKFADYTGNFFDNPYMFDLGKTIQKKKEETLPKTELLKEEEIISDILPEAVDEPLEEEKKVILTDDYNPEAARTFSDIASFNGGEMCFSKGPDSIVDDIMKSLDRIEPKNKVDVIFAIDATGSMKDDIEKLRTDWIPRLIESLNNFENLRIALLLYRDYGDTYKLMGLPVKRFEFTDKIETFNRNLNSFVIYGSEGGDIPEAVYEALYGSLTFYTWRADAYKKIILIGDAEPHPSPRGTGKYSKELVAQTAKAKNVVIDSIIVPDDKSRRGR